MNNGFITLQRSMLEWEWYDDNNTKVLFIHCLLKANWTDKEWRGNIIKRGSFITNLQKLSDETSLSVQKIRTSLKKLKSTGEITIKTSNINHYITVTNYNSYQDSNKQSNKRITNEQQTNNKQITTTKQRNKETKKQNNNITLPIFVDESLWNEFLEIREKKKAVNSERALTAIIKQLSKFHDMNHDVNGIIETSIVNSWKSVYEPKNNYGGSNESGTRKDRLAIATERTMREINEGTF